MLSTADVSINKLFKLTTCASINKLFKPTAGASINKLFKPTAGGYKGTVTPTAYWSNSSCGAWWCGGHSCVCKIWFAWKTHKYEQLVTNDAQCCLGWQGKSSMHRILVAAETTTTNSKWPWNEKYFCYALWVFGCTSLPNALTYTHTHTKHQQHSANKASNTNTWRVWYYLISVI